MDAIEQVLDAPVVGGAGAPHQPVDLVTVLEQQLGEVGAVLAGDAGDQRFLLGHERLSRTRTSNDDRRNPLRLPIRMLRASFRDSGLSGGIALVRICSAELRAATSRRADSWLLDTVS